MASMLSKMFQQSRQQTTQQRSPLEQLAQIRQQGSSNFMFNQMYQSNPAFRQFADSMQGKTPEQAFKEHGLDFDKFKNYKW